MFKNIITYPTSFIQYDNFLYFLAILKPYITYVLNDHFNWQSQLSGLLEKSAQSDQRFCYSHSKKCNDHVINAHFQCSR